MTRTMAEPRWIPSKWSAAALGCWLVLGCGAEPGSDDADDAGGSGGSLDGSGGFSAVGGGPGAGGAGSGGLASGGNSSGGADGSGGLASGGSSSGGADGSGGDNGSGGAPTGGSSSGGSGGGSSEWYPCNGSTSGYKVVVSGGGSSWNVTGGGSAASFGDLASALGSAYGRLTAGRTTKEAILVQGSGSVDASVQLKMPSYMVLNVCGTIDVTGTPSGSDRSPLYARDRTHIDIPHVRLTGNAQYGMFFRSVSNIHLGEIEIDGTAGIGIRIDNNPSAGGAKVTNVVIDHIDAANTGSHALETYGVDGLEVGRVDAEDTGECGVLLNATVNAEVGSVYCDNCAAGTGYAAFRIANNAGKIGSSWPAGNIHVGHVYARGGGRGIFSVSGSGGLTIDTIDIANTGNNSILLQNCYNTTIAGTSGSVQNGTIVLSNDTTNTNNGTFVGSQNVKLQKLTLGSSASITEGWCQLGDRGNRATNITGGSVDMCF